MSVQQYDTAPEKASKNRLRLWLKLLKTTNLIEDELRRRLRNEFDRTLPRFDVMSALDRNPDGLKMSEISRLLQVSNGNVTGIVDRLVKDGLAERCNVPNDRRASRVHLTQKGRHEFVSLADEHEKWVDELLGCFDEKEVAILFRLMDKIQKEASE